MKKRIILLSCLALCMGCALPEKPEAQMVDTAQKEFAWPTGRFQVYEEDAVYTETWMHTGDNEYEGIGCSLSNDDCDTLFRMSMHLHKDHDKILMSYLVKDQNDDKTTEFTLTSHEKNVCVFETPFRSFPSIMKYELRGDTALCVVQRGYDKHNGERTCRYVLNREE